MTSDMDTVTHPMRILDMNPIWILPMLPHSSEHLPRLPRPSTTETPPGSGKACWILWRDSLGQHMTQGLIAITPTCIESVRLEQMLLHAILCDLQRRRFVACQMLRANCACSPWRKAVHTTVANGQSAPVTVS